MRGEIDAAGYEAELALARERITSSGAAHWQAYLAAWERCAEPVQASGQLAL
jgi:hypothetical protein